MFEHMEQLSQEINGFLSRFEKRELNRDDVQQLVRDRLDVVLNTIDTSKEPNLANIEFNQ